MLPIYVIGLAEEFNHFLLKWLLMNAYFISQFCYNRFSWHESHCDT